ncbi:MAG: helix-turn-helix transcriptional regulator [Nitrososphaerota archaeon]
MNSEIANDILEFASEQRVSILLRLHENDSTVSKIAKELGATIPEVFRNCGRLATAELIEKGPDGSYHLTMYGKTVCAQLPSFVFMAKKRKYFKNHDFGDLQTKFIQRIGALDSSQHITGFVKVVEQCNEVYNNSKKYIYNVLSEVWYNQDLMKTLVEKLEHNVSIRSIFAESTIVPKERKRILEKTDFKKFTLEGVLERKMKKEISISVLLNEKEACVMFPTRGGSTDFREMIYSDDPTFHEWCYDYFSFCWENAGAFREDKLKMQ